jgi:hypothetical protein
MLGSSDPTIDPTSFPLLLDLSSDTSFLPVVRLPIDSLHEFGTSAFLMGISSVVTVSSKISSYIACQSWHISTYLLDA